MFNYPDITKSWVINLIRIGTSITWTFWSGSSLWTFTKTRKISWVKIKFMKRSESSADTSKYNKKTSQWIWSKSWNSFGTRRSSTWLLIAPRELTEIPGLKKDKLSLINSTRDDSCMKSRNCRGIKNSAKTFKEKRIRKDKMFYSLDLLRKNKFFSFPSSVNSYPKSSTKLCRHTNVFSCKSELSSNWRNTLRSYATSIAWRWPFTKLSSLLIKIYTNIWIWLRFWEIQTFYLMCMKKESSQELLKKGLIE